MSARRNLTQQIASRATDPDFYAALSFLPNPDAVLRKLGKQQEVYENIAGDAHVVGDMRAIRGALLGYEMRILPGSDDPASMRAFDLCKRVMSKPPAPGLTWSDIVWSMGCAIFNGFAVHEVVWSREGSLLLPAKVIDRPQKRFLFGPENELRLRTRTNPDSGIQTGANKWLITRHMGSFDNPYGAAIFSSLFWPYTFKHAGFRYLVKFSERYGFPWPIGKYPAGTSSQDQEALANRLAEMVEDAVAVIPNDSSVELLQVEQSGKLVQERLINLCNREISKALTSQTLATEIDSRASGAASQTHRQRECAVNQCDRTIIELTFNDLFRWITEINVNHAVPPKFTFFREAESRLEMAEFLNEANSLVPLSRREVYERLQMSEPTRKSDTVPVPSNKARTAKFQRAPIATIRSPSPKLSAKQLSSIDHGDALRWCITMKAKFNPNLDMGSCIDCWRKIAEFHGGDWAELQERSKQRVRKQATQKPLSLYQKGILRLESMLKMLLTNAGRGWR